LLSAAPRRSGAANPEAEWPRGVLSDDAPVEELACADSWSWLTFVHTTKRQTNHQID